MSRRLLAGVTAALALGAAVTGGLTSSAQAGSAPRIEMLSSRADLASGGDALIEIVPAGGGQVASLRVEVNGRDASRLLVRRPGGRAMALIGGLKLGPNQITASAPGSPTVQLTVTNHPNGGPIFAGSQVQPWTCPAIAVDRQCTMPVRYQYWYMPQSRTGFAAYNPDSPPSDVAMTTTDQGRTVPYIVREEIGSQDRGEYRIAVLFEPDAVWAPWAPQPGWNGKAYTTGGSGCGMRHGMTPSPSVLDDNALQRGFAVISTSLADNQANCNLVVQAEALMMLKERTVEAYGPIRYTIGSGCSGGSIYQQQVANAYPGIFDGILPDCSFPDSWSTLLEAEDCALLTQYWGAPSEWDAGIAWSDGQHAAVAGHPSTSICRSWRDVYGFTEALNPSVSAHPLGTQNCNVSNAQGYDPKTNPKGVRCALQDYMASVLGRRASDGFANRPWDNVGVEYGLGALQDGTISPAQFVDLNVKIGSHSLDYVWQARRVQADAAALPTAYRGGLVNEANNLDLIPIIDLRGHDVAEIHHDYRSYVMRARLDAANGGHANQVIWTASRPFRSDVSVAADALTVMDAWIAAIKADSSRRSQAAKVVANKPADARDKCTDGAGHDLPDQSVCPDLNPYYASPRIVAGSPFAEDVMKCALRPMQEQAYLPARFTPEQWKALQAVHPQGVCDWSRAGQGQQPTVPWMTYASGPGGRALPNAPTSYVARSAPVAVVRAPVAEGRGVLPSTGGTPAIAALLLLGLATGIHLLTRRSNGRMS